MGVFIAVLAFVHQPVQPQFDFNATQTGSELDVRPQEISTVFWAKIEFAGIHYLGQILARQFSENEGEKLNSEQHVLIVEDDPNDVIFIQRAFQDIGITRRPHICTNAPFAPTLLMPSGMPPLPGQ